MGNIQAARRGCGAGSRSQTAHRDYLGGPFAFARHSSSDASCNGLQSYGDSALIGGTSKLQGEGVGLSPIFIAHNGPPRSPRWAVCVCIEVARRSEEHSSSDASRNGLQSYVGFSPYRGIIYAVRQGCRVGSRSLTARQGHHRRGRLVSCHHGGSLPVGMIFPHSDK